MQAMMIDEKTKSALEQVKVVKMKESPSIVCVLMESSVECTAQSCKCKAREHSFPLYSQLKRVLINVCSSVENGNKGRNTEKRGEGI